jgi:hypothetical protein
MIDEVRQPGDCIQLAHFHLKTINTAMATPVVPVPAPSPASGGVLREPILIPKEKIAIGVAGDVCGGGTGKEFKENLLKDGKESWNKWLHPGYLYSSWILYDFGDHVFDVAAYGLCSANDCPHRDPIAWTLQGYDAETHQWIMLHHVSRDDDLFQSRFQWHWYSLEKVKSCSKVRLMIDEVRQPGDCIQLAHFHVKTTSTVH